MATVLTDLNEIYDPDLYLPIRGMVYRIPAPTIVEGDRLRTLVWDSELTPQELHDEIVKILGPAHQQMVDDEIPAPYRDHAGCTAIVHFGASTQLGREYWMFSFLGEMIDIDALITRLLDRNEDLVPADGAVADGD